MDEGQQMQAIGVGEQGALSVRRKRTQRGSRGTALFVALIAALMLTPLFAFGAKAAPAPAQTDVSANFEWSAPTTVYIPDTGQTIDGVFLDFWRNSGGAEAYGNPITPEFTLNGHIVQYYDYARFEYWPEDPDNVVHLGTIGSELRPQLVMRQTTSDSTSSAVAEMARVSRAWLPVAKSVASKPESDTFTYIADTGHSVANGFKAFWEDSGGAAYLGNPLTEEYQLGNSTYQVFERGQLAWTQGSDPWLVEVGDQLAQRQGISTAAVDQGDVPTYDESLFTAPDPSVPNPNAVNNSGEKWLEVNLSEQYMTVWAGDEVVLGTYVSTGREGFDTPTGTFFINTMLESQTMEGVLGGEYYNVPDVPWVMYFTDMGHAIHGTYWHSNFGQVMSHGCVNLPMDVAEWLYNNFAFVGMRVEIHY
jgi:lipoprotein-anchoring transpeptidase ErfK/SrfK